MVLEVAHYLFFQHYSITAMHGMNLLRTDHNLVASVSPVCLFNFIVARAISLCLAVSRASLMRHLVVLPVYPGPACQCHDTHLCFCQLTFWILTSNLPLEGGYSLHPVLLILNPSISRITIVAAHFSLISVMILSCVNICELLYLLDFIINMGQSYPACNLFVRVC